MLYIIYIINYLFNTYIRKVLVTQSCPTLRDPMSISPLCSPVHGILQARMLKWVFPSPGDLPHPQTHRLTQISCTDRQILHHLSQ